MVRQGLKQILSKTPDLVVVDEAETGYEVLTKLKATSVDVLVMDIEMPDKTGLDVLLELQQTHSQLPVIMLSIYSEDQFGLRFLKAGASGYLSQDQCARKTGRSDPHGGARRKVCKSELS